MDNPNFVELDFNRKRRKPFKKPFKKDENPEDGKKKEFTPKYLSHSPGPVCLKVWRTERSMIRHRHSNRYRKDIKIPLDGGNGEKANKWTIGKREDGSTFKVPPVNQIWASMLQVMCGSKPKKRIRNIRMPEPKPTGKRR